MKWSFVGKTVRFCAVCLLVFGVGFFVVTIGPGLLLGLLLTLGSERTVFERATSPDGWHEARVQFDDGGAISPFDRLVFVKSSWNPSDAPPLSCRAFWADGEAVVHLRWLNNHELLIEHGFPSRAIEAVTTNCGSIQITTQSLSLAR